MSIPTRPASARRLGYVCPSCRLAQRRTIATTFLVKQKEARDQWALFAQDIRDNKRMSPLAMLEARGFVHQTTGVRDSLDELMINKRLGVYCGVDPTAPSLHVGHMLPLMALFWMHITGFHTVTLIGAGTGRIGDPTGRSKDRPMMTNTERKANIVGLHYQVKKLWSNLEVTAQRHGFPWQKYWHREVVNNATWWNKTPFVDVLKYLGTGLRIGEMLKRDTVVKKMESGEGMSLAEFCYPVMQAWDWWHMYDTKDIQMQIGGADQFGNIVAGVDAVKHLAKTHPDPDIRQEGGVKPETTPYGLTVPLLKTAAGTKFGKSAGNAVWLDENMTDVFELYAFFVKTADADVERYLKLFTFLSLDSIAKLMEQHLVDTSKQAAQKTLAYEFVHLVHGGDKARATKAKHESLAASRKSTTLSSLLPASNLGTADEHEQSQTQPSQYATDELSPPPTPTNPLSDHRRPSEQRRATFVSPKLNPYAPPHDPNLASGMTQHIILPASLVRGQSVAKALYSAGLVSSRSEGHRLAQNQGAYIGRASSNKGPMTDELQFVPAKLADPNLMWANVIRDHDSGAMDQEGEEGLLILRSGKWKVRVIRLVTDEKFETLGLPDPPGWQEHKSLLVAARAQAALDDGLPAAGHSVSAFDDKTLDTPEEATSAAGHLAGKDGSGKGVDQRLLDSLEHEALGAEFVDPSSRGSRDTRQAAYFEQKGAALTSIDRRARAAERLNDSEFDEARSSRTPDSQPRKFPWEQRGSRRARPRASAPSATATPSEAQQARLREAKRQAVLETWRAGNERVRRESATARARLRRAEQERMHRDWLRNEWLREKARSNATRVRDLPDTPPDPPPPRQRDVPVEGAGEEADERARRRDEHAQKVDGGFPFFQQ